MFCKMGLQKYLCSTVLMIVCADYYVYRYVFKTFYHKMCVQVCMQRIMCVEYSIVSLLHLAGYLLGPPPC